MPAAACCRRRRVAIGPRRTIAGAAGAEPAGIVAEGETAEDLTSAGAAEAAGLGSGASGSMPSRSTHCTPTFIACQI